MDGPLFIFILSRNINEIFFTLKEQSRSHLKTYSAKCNFLLHDILFDSRKKKWTIVGPKWEINRALVSGWSW